MKNKVVYVKNSITDGHFAFQSNRAKKPFQNPMRECMSIPLNKSDVVADIGAYVGEYSMYASKFVKEVLAYEPTPETFEVLAMNKRKNINIFNYAVVGNDEKETNLFISRGIGVTNSIVKSQGKADMIKVKTIKYEDAIKNATVVKIDVEGAEYTYEIIQPQLRAIILEFHPIAKRPWQMWANNIMEEMERKGFKPITKPEFKHGWDLIGSWQK